MESEKHIVRTSAHLNTPFAVEPLESRRLMAKWGGWLTDIDLPSELAKYPSITGKGQTIAILDTGVDYTNPVFGKSGFGKGYKVRAGYNFVDNNTDFLDTNGHGTAVAATAAANAYSYRGRRYQGVASGAQIAALKIDDGSGNISDATYRAALEWVIGYRYKYNITAVNISEGGDTTYPDAVSNGSLSDLLAQLKSMGVFVAISSGNDGDHSGVEYPAADVSAVAVGSNDLDDTISSFSDTGNDLDLLAPGNEVVAPALDANGNKTFIYAQGTSFSSPIAAAASMLLKQQNPNASVDDIITTLQNTGTPITDNVNGLTFSRVDVFDAVNTVSRYLKRRGG